MSVINSDKLLVKYKNYSTHTFIAKDRPKTGKIWHFPQKHLMGLLSSFFLISGSRLLGPAIETASSSRPQCLLWERKSYSNTRVSFSLRKPPQAKVQGSHIKLPNNLKCETSKNMSFYLLSKGQVNLPTSIRWNYFQNDLWLQLWITSFFRVQKLRWREAMSTRDLSFLFLSRKPCVPHCMPRNIRVTMTLVLMSQVYLSFDADRYKQVFCGEKPVSKEVVSLLAHKLTHEKTMCFSLELRNKRETIPGVLFHSAHFSSFSMVKNTTFRQASSVRTKRKYCI